jgi:hypothetical protein
MAQLVSSSGIVYIIFFPHQPRILFIISILLAKNPDICEHTKNLPARIFEDFKRQHIQAKEKVR